MGKQSMKIKGKVKINSASPLFLPGLRIAEDRLPIITNIPEFSTLASKGKQIGFTTQR